MRKVNPAISGQFIQFYFNGHSFFVSFFAYLKADSCKLMVRTLVTYKSILDHCLQHTCKGIPNLHAKQFSEKLVMNLDRNFMNYCN